MIRKWPKSNLKKTSTLINHCTYLILRVRFLSTIFDWEKGSTAEFQPFLQGSKLYEGRTMSVLVVMAFSTPGPLLGTW